MHFTNGEEISWEEIICHFPNLKSFIFHNKCTDKILEHVAIFCPDIEEIDVKSSPIFSNGVKYLCENRDGQAACTKLKKLHIFNTKIKADDVKYLIQNLPLLEIIDYDDLPLVLYSMYKDLSSLDNVKPYKIAKLNLSTFVNDPSFVGIRKVCLTVCPNLKSLTYALSAKDNLDFFPKLFKLEKLYLNTSLSKINIDRILKAVGEKLAVLMVVTAKVSLTVLTENCPSINILQLNAVDLIVDSDSKPTFASLSSLEFNYYFSDIPKNAKAIILLLSSSEKLESLSFEGCDLTHSEVCGYVLRCCERYPIKKLSFCDSFVEKDFIKDLLLNCHTLRCLNIKGCFKKKHEDELLELVKFLPNKPKICISDRPVDTESEDDSDEDSIEDSDDYFDPDEDLYDCPPYDGCGFY